MGGRVCFDYQRRFEDVKSEVYSVPVCLSGAPVGADDHLHVARQRFAASNELCRIRIQCAGDFTQTARVFQCFVHMMTATDVSQLYHDLAGGDGQLVG